jgi:hypothetical protein
MTLEVVRGPVVPLSLDGLVAHWTFDGTWKAHPSSAPSLTATGSLAGTDEAFSWGRIADAVVFDDSLESYAAGSVGEEGCEQPLDIAELPVTVAAWVRLGTFARAPQAVFSTEGSSTDSPRTYAGAWVTLQPSPGGYWSAVAHFGSGESADSASWRSLRSEGMLRAGEWYHLAIVLHGGNDMRIFVDGTRVVATEYEGGATALGHATPRGCPQVGHWEGPDEQLGFEGHIDELYVFSRALSDTEVAAISLL